MLQGDGPVFIFNGDVLSSHDLNNQLQLHSSSEADATLHLTQVKDARAFGVVEMDGNRIISFNEKMENPPTNIINAGCYIFNREIIDRIPSGRVVSVERETFPDLLESGAVVTGFVDESYWLDIGTPEALLKATSDLISGVAQSPAFDELLTHGGFQRESGALISVDATVGESVSISGGSIIEAGALLNSEVTIQSSVIGEGVVIGHNSSLTTSFVAQNCEIPAGTIARGQFFGFSTKK
jgi:mannose-1-phosphate guanylyltransferase